MTSFRIRPRFKHISKETKQELEERIKNALEKEGVKCIGEQLPGYINLKIPIKQRHFWSPQLNITIEENEDGSIIRGLYGPNPTVWAVFFFGYVTVGILVLFLGMWGLTRYSLGIESNILWSVPVLLTIGLGLYITAQLGQKLGAEQMYDLHHFYEETINGDIRIT